MLQTKYKNTSRDKVMRHEVTYFQLLFIAICFMFFINYLKSSIFLNLKTKVGLSYFQIIYVFQNLHITGLFKKS